MRRVPLEPKPPPDRTSEPGYREWHQPLFGRCECCGRPGRLLRHHVILEQHVRALDGDPWDLRNAIKLGVHCRCHAQHHLAAARLPCSKVPAPAIEFASELLGPGPADLYFDRYYAPR